MSRILGLKKDAQLDSKKGLMSMGMDSLLAVEFRNRLKASLGPVHGKSLSPTLIFNHPTIHAITDYLLKEILSQSAIPSVSKVKKQKTTDEPIAIIGMSCRFPGGANDLDSFWDLLSLGKSGVSEIPSDRWDVDTYHDSNPDAPGKMNTRRGAFIQNPALFDSRFFGISPIEAENMDPQQRWLSETTWEALENAGVSPHTLFEQRLRYSLGSSP